MLLMKRIAFGPNRMVGRCGLPLDWFPTNRIVREWFPMTLQACSPFGEIKTWVLLDVHVEDRKVPKFKTAFANLRVIPNWRRPADADAECVAPPQVVFVIPQHGDGGVVWYRTVGTAQYASPELVQGAGNPTQEMNCTLGQPEYYYPSVGVISHSEGGSYSSAIPPAFVYE
jgi:hypothetical protein